MNEFELMSGGGILSGINVVHVTIVVQAVVLIALALAVALLWQRQKVQTDLVARLIGEMANATRDKRLQRRRRSFEEALQGADASNAIEPVAEPQPAQEKSVETDASALSDGEARLLQFIRQREVEPLHEHA